MTTTFDPALCEQKILEARKMIDGVNAPPWTKVDALLAALADQLEAAAHVVMRLREHDARQSATVYRFGCDLEAAWADRDALRVELEAAMREVARLNGVDRAAADRIMDLEDSRTALTAERDALRAEVERLTADTAPLTPERLA